MSDPILATKLFPPPTLPRAVTRQHLIERLDQSLHRKLTLLSAPPGFGKSTLISEWIASSNRPVAWLSLDPADSDPPRFLSYMIAALQSIQPGFGAAPLTALETPHPPPAEAVLTAILNEIVTFESDLILVLDDYHALSSSAVDDALTFLIDHLPPSMHLVIATREDPAIPLSRLRARGQMTELRSADLRFDTSETESFLNQVMDLDLSGEDIAALAFRTEGWIAGLQLAALSMRGREDVGRFIRAFAGDDRYIVDYLVEEVLQRQSQQVREFLLQTSILDRLNAELCDAVTGDSDGKALLEMLERGNLFVIPLDDMRHWFRYHHLFADVLKSRALEELPERLPHCHQRASEWYERAGLMSESIRHAFAAEDFERAAILVERIAHEMLMSRLEETFLGWLNEFPDGIVPKRPVLSAYYALALVSFDLEAAEAPLRDAERFLEFSTDVGEGSQATPEEFVIVDEGRLRSLAGLTCIIRAYKSGAMGDVSGIVQYAQRALDHLPEDEYVWRGAAASLLGLAQWTNGDLEAAYRSFADGIALLRMSGDITQTLSGAFIQANIRTAQGRLRDVERTYEQAMKLIPGPGQPLSPPAVDLYVGLSELYREYNDLESATQCLQRTREMSESGGISEYRHHWYIAMALVKDAQGEPDQALDLLDEAERLFIPSPDPVVRPISALKARVWIREGRLVEAQGWSRQRRLSPDDDLSYLREFEHITLARILIAESRHNEARTFLRRLERSAEEGGRFGNLIEILVLQAIAHQGLGDDSSAVASLKRALELAEPEGYVRVFVGEGKPIERLLFAVAREGVSRDYAARLLSAFEDREPESVGELATDFPQPVPGLVEPLSRRELEVLRLVAQGLSNREISERLFLALNTVKGHNRVIFDKLQVRRRTEAVARARELGLL